MCKKSEKSVDHLSLHYRVGHAPMGGGVVGLLERLVW